MPRKWYRRSQSKMWYSLADAVYGIQLKDEINKKEVIRSTNAEYLFFCAFILRGQKPIR